MTLTCWRETKNELPEYGLIVEAIEAKVGWYHKPVIRQAKRISTDAFGEHWEVARFNDDSKEKGIPVEPTYWRYIGAPPEGFGL